MLKKTLKHNFIRRKFDFLKGHVYHFQNFREIRTWAIRNWAINTWAIRSSANSHLSEKSIVARYNFPNLSQNFPTICVFRPKARKINAWFVKIFEKYAKIMHFHNFLKKYLKIFENYPASWGLHPRTPHKADPKKCFSPPKNNSWLRPCLGIFPHRKCLQFRCRY